MAGRARSRTSAVHRNGDPGAASSLRTGTCSESQRGRPEDTAVRRLATDQGRAVNTSHTLPSPHRPGEPLCGIQRADCSPTHVASERSSRTVSAADSYFIRPGCDARWILSAIPGFTSLELRRQRLRLVSAWNSRVAMGSSFHTQPCHALHVFMTCLYAGRPS